MLHHWLIAVPRTLPAESSVADRISAVLGQSLYYRPDDALLHRFEEGCYVMSVSAGMHAWRMAPPHVLSADGFVAVAGVPTLERVRRAEKSIPETLCAVLRRHGPDRLYETVGGTFSVGRVDVLGGERLSITALSDFSGYNSLFYLDSPDYFAIGNRASFVGAFRAGYPERNTTDADVISWLFGTTMIMGTRTPFPGVSRVRTGYRVALTFDRRAPHQRAEVIRMSSHHFSGLPPGKRRGFRLGERRKPQPANIEAIDFDAACTRMANRVEWCANHGVDFRAHLTGGRDTRAIAGVLAARGGIAYIDRFTSLGTEESGDVIVGRKVAERLALGERHVVAPGGKGVSSLAADDLHAALRRSAFLYDGYLSAWDGRRAVATHAPSWVMLMGGGGEVYRQEWGSSEALSGPDGWRQALSMFCRHDALRLLSDAAMEYQASEIGHELRLLSDDGAANLACAFYMEERLANWGCGHFSNAVATQFPVLLDRELAQAVFAIDDIGEDVHFEVLRLCGHGLLEIPFLNKRWVPRTEERARVLGLAPEPIKVPHERSFPWQFTSYRTYRNAIIDFCLECGGALQHQVPTGLLEEAKRKPVEPFGSAHVKMLFGLAGAICLVSGASHGRRDLTATGKVQMSGSHVSLIAEMVEDEAVKQHDVSDRLRTHLRAVAPRDANNG